MYTMHLFENCCSKYEDLSFRSIRLIIFLITGLYVGFPTVLWALHVLYRHRKSRGQISVIAIFLLITDLLEMILIPFIAGFIFTKDLNPCVIVFRLLFGVRLCGHLLHQIVAVESIFQRYLSLGKVFSPLCSITSCIVVFVLIIGCQFIYVIRSKIIFGACVLPVIICAVTFVLKWKAPLDVNQTTDRKPGVLVLTVAMFSLIILYIPFFITVFAGLPLMLDSLASMRLISDPLLCVLVCKEPGINVKHTHTSNEIN